MSAALELIDQEPFRFLISFGAILFLTLNLAAILVMGERKVAGYIQLRFGPNRVGPRGLLQPLADIVKLFTKENVAPGRADLWIFLGAPIALFIPAVLAWLVVPFAPGAVVADLNVAILFFVAVTSIGALGVIMAGYGSRSTFSLLGALRGAAQMISYEVPLILSLLGIVMLTGSLSMVDIVNAQGGGFWNWYFVAQFPMFIVFYVAGIAEVKRPPFDLPEGESEIVGGFMIEYSGMTWALDPGGGVLLDGAHVGDHHHALSWRVAAAVRVFGPGRVQLVLVRGQELRLSCSRFSGSGGACRGSEWTNLWTSDGKCWSRFVFSGWSLRPARC